MNEREKLIEEMENLVKIHPNSGISRKLSQTMKRWEFEMIADFILEDRRRTIDEYKIVFFCDCDKQP